MTEDQYRERIFAVERYVNRLAFLCPDGCAGWYHHAQATISHLTSAVDAEWYDVALPAPSTGIPHLNADIARHLDWFRQRWAKE